MVGLSSCCRHAASVLAQYKLICFLHKSRVLSASFFRLMFWIENSSCWITSKHSWDVKSLALSTFFTSLLRSVFPLSLLVCLRWYCSCSLRSMGLALYAGP